MKVLVHVEGPSDRVALEALLRPLIDEGQRAGVGIRFLPKSGKNALLKEVPLQAADHLAQFPGDCVIALPDLYPLDPTGRSGFLHASYEDLLAAMRDRFQARADKRQLPAATRSRFRVHCLKFDLEALLLACPESLRQRLGTSDALGAWRKPVEDQNGDTPPKYIVKELFSKYRPRTGYVDTSDAPWILGRADLATIEKSCRERFGPFVGDLRRLVSGQDLVRQAPSKGSRGTARSQRTSRKSS